jgi:hypothetical protein
LLLSKGMTSPLWLKSALPHVLFARVEARESGEEEGGGPLRATRSSECDVDAGLSDDVDLAAVVEVYSDLAAVLRTKLHNLPEPQGVVLSAMHKSD